MERMVSRSLDWCICLPALVLLSPVLLVLIALIRVTTRGPAFFKQQRAGRNGRPFTLYKFRTMRPDADPYGDSPRSEDDPRLTRIGRFLRETSLDELPQLFNILKGDMTLVGPRPLYVTQMAEWTEHQRRRLEVTPGLTGLAQISGRGALTREQKLALDVLYVETRSPGLDLKILWTTLRQVFCRKAIYEVRYSESQQTRSEMPDTR